MLGLGDTPKATPTHIVDGTDASFMQDVVETSKTVPVIVDFWAPWCGPCKQLTPILEKVVIAAQGKVKLVKINIDENPGTPGKFGVRGIPTLMLFKNGELTATKVGAAPKGALQQWVEEHI